MNSGYQVIFRWIFQSSSRGHLAVPGEPQIQKTIFLNKGNTHKRT